MKATQRRTADY